MLTQLGAAGIFLVAFIAVLGVFAGVYVFNRLRRRARGRA